MNDSDYPRAIRKALGKAPTLGGLPSNLLFPSAIAFAIAAMTRTIFGLSWGSMFLLASALIATWWIATGGHSYRFFSQFSRLFLPSWIRGGKAYTPLLNRHDSPRS